MKIQTIEDFARPQDLAALRGVRLRLLYRCLLRAQDRAVDLAKHSMPLTDHVWSAARGQTVYGPLVAIVDKIANDVGAFHWPIEFPHIFARQRARVSNE